MATAPLPPSYDETMEKGYGAPPSYTELFPVKDLKTEVFNAREEGLTPSVPLKICSLFCKSIACGICYIILALLPLTMIIIGSVYYNDCSIQPRVPLFLVVFGSVGLLQTAFHIIQMILCRKKDENDHNRENKEKGGNCCESLLTMFLLVWIIIGSYYIFSSFRDWNNHGHISCSGSSNSEYCCDAPVMIFAFSVLILIYSVGFCCCCFICCCLGCVSAITGGANNN